MTWGWDTLRELNVVNMNFSYFLREVVEKKQVIKNDCGGDTSAVFEHVRKIESLSQPEH